MPKSLPLTGLESGSLELEVAQLHCQTNIPSRANTACQLLARSGAKLVRGGCRAGGAYMQGPSDSLF